MKVWSFAFLIAAALMTGAITVQSQAALVSYHNLNGQSDDQVGSNDLSAFGDAGFGASLNGGLGQAGTFDGVDDGFIGNSFAGISGNDATVVAWVWANSLPDWATIAKNWGDSIAGQFHFGAGQAAADTLNNFATDSSGAGFSIGTSASNIPLNQWVHVAFVLDSSAGQQRMYINGALDGPAAAYTDLDQTPAVGGAFGIGNKPNDAGDNVGAVGDWDGLIDEVGVFDEALSVNQIAQIIADAQEGIQLDGSSVPEPASLALLGLGGLMLLRSRKA